jgi:hypothetical protein
MKNSSHSYDFLWLGIALFPLLTIAILLPVQPHDYWWYLRLGKDILENGAVPVMDTYSSIQAGQPLVYQHWLSAVLLWLTYKIAGISGTFLLLAILIGLTYALLWALMRQMEIGPRLATLLTLLAGLSGSNNWGARPQLFAYPLFLAVLWLLLKWQEREQKYLWALIPLSFVWANLHGSFILFFILVGLAVVFGAGDRKKLFQVTLFALAVTLINPRGLTLWQSVLETLLSPVSNKFVTEWSPPVNLGWQMNIFFAWLILLVPLAVFARRRPTVLEFSLFILFSWLAFKANRFVIWDLFIIATFTASLMPDFITNFFDRPVQVKTPTINLGLGTALLLMPLMLLPGFRENLTSETIPSIDPQTPIAATEWLSENPEFSGMMWNDVVFGSYLIYGLPARPVWMDTRFQIIYTPQQVEQYLFVQAAQPGWDSYLEENGINLLFLAKTQPALVEAVKNSSQWCEQYYDDVAFIFSRCEPLP